MKFAHAILRTFAATLLFAGAFAQAATVTGTVTDKTTGKPSAGDTVVLVDVQSSMAEVARATTDARGYYSLNKPGAGPYLIKATHQGTPYFIAAPDGPGSGEIAVYDAAPKVDGISIEADVLEMETENGQLKINERYFVHNTSSPQRTQYSPHGFEVVLPAEAVVDSSEASRPTGMATIAQLTPTGQKGHYTFDFPIQPDEGDKETHFSIEYHIPYNGKATFHPLVSLPTEDLAVLLPKSIAFTAGAGMNFQTVTQDPNIQTFLAKNATPGKAVEFTITGTGSMPRENQGTPQQGMGAGAGGQTGGQDSGDAGAAAGGANRPGGGIGAPIGGEDPLSKYKWWILGGLGIALVIGAAFFLRKPPESSEAMHQANTAAAAHPQNFSSPIARNSALLNALKEELFAVESEKLGGAISPEEYAEVKGALEIVLKRALKRKA